MKKILIGLLLTLALLFSPGRARAADGAKDEGWEQVDGGMMTQPGESFQATNLVATAYAFIWLMVAGFVVSVWVRSNAVEREVDALRRLIEQRAGTGKAAD